MSEFRPPLPTYVSYEEGISEISGKTCRDYLKKVFEVYVRDTPFRKSDICQLHEELVDVSNPGQIKFKTTTVSRELLRMQNDGLILLFDGHASNAKDHLYFWGEGIPQLKKARERELVEQESDLSVVKRQQELTSEKANSEDEPQPALKNDNPMKPFFENLFRKVLNL